MAKKLIGELELNRIYQRDCIEGMRLLPDDSVDLIVIDPPYNIGKDKRWDKWKTVDSYVEFMSEVFTECERVLKPSGSFYWFHNDMNQIRKLMDSLDEETEFTYRNFIVWNKRYSGSHRKFYFDNVVKTESSRSYRPLSEYCLFYTLQDETGISKKLPAALKPLREYMNRYLVETGMNFNQIDIACGWVRKKNPKQGTGLARHFFQGNGSYIFPTKDVFNKLHDIFNFDRTYESLRQEYESLRYVFNHQKTHHDVWDYEVAPKQGHITPKPVEMIENIIRHSSNEGDVVLDCFMGSGTTAVAATKLNRHFIGFERESEYIEIANKRLDNETEAV